MTTGCGHFMACDLKNLHVIRQLHTAHTLRVGNFVCRVTVCRAYRIRVTGQRMHAPPTVFKINSAACKVTIRLTEIYYYCCDWWCDFHHHRHQQQQKYHRKHECENLRAMSEKMLIQQLPILWSSSAAQQYHNIESFPVNGLSIGGVAVTA